MTLANRENEPENTKTAQKEEIPEDATLRIVSEPWEDFKQESLDDIREFESGEDTPKHVLSFSDPNEIQRILTPKRLEIIRSVMNETPESMRDLAERLDRGTREIHDDLHLLEKYGIVRFEEDGRAKKPVIPYDNIKIEVELSNPEPEN